jgi:Bacteriophage tail sheath protein
MPVTLSYPGVYIEEIPSGVRSISGVATSITAFVGYTVRGPVDQAVRLANFGDFERNFGGLQQDSEISYAVQQFFLNGGSDAYVVRVAAGAAAAQVSLADLAGNVVLNVSAENAGSWGNLMRLDVDYLTGNPDSTFNLTITLYQLQNGKLVFAQSETYRNLSMNSFSPTYVPNVINGDSKLISIPLPLPVVPALTKGGWARSVSLHTFPTLAATDTTITGNYDTTNPFTLVITGAVPNSVATLVTAVNAAITAAGLAGTLAATAVDALGAAGTDYLQLTSTSVANNSGVQILRAASNDLAAKIGLGLVNGGREKEAASALRPEATGTTSASIADLIDAATSVSGNLDVTVTDEATSTTLFTTSVPLVLPAVVAGPTLRDALQALLRGTNNPATAQATVQLYGTFLNVVASASTPNAAITFGNTVATTIKLAGAGSAANVQEYSLGTGTTFGAQSGASPGADGTPPSSALQIEGDEAKKSGIYALLDVDLFNLLVIPRTTQLPDADAKDLIAKAVALCEARRAFFIVDPNPKKDITNIGDWVGGITASRNAAVYFPQILAADPLQDFRIHPMPASGALAGIYASTDATRGVWKAPAGIDAIIQGAQGLNYTLTDAENGTLNPLGINCLRTFAVYGTVTWGARTLFGSDARADEYKYIPVRRIALYIEESLYRGTKWVVFEPNDEPLWAQIRLNVGAFMQTLFRQGAFQGTTPQAAYFVKCDSETTTSTDQNLGVVNILVGFAPLKPAEFVVIQIQQMAGQTAA